MQYTKPINDGLVSPGHLFFNRSTIHLWLEYYSYGAARPGQLMIDKVDILNLAVYETFSSRSVIEYCNYCNGVLLVVYTPDQPIYKACASSSVRALLASFLV